MENRDEIFRNLTNRAAIKLGGKGQDSLLFLSAYFEVEPENIYAVKSGTYQGFSDLFYVISRKKFAKTTLARRIYQILKDDPDGIVIVQAMPDVLHIATLANRFPQRKVTQQVLIEIDGLLIEIRELDTYKNNGQYEIE